MFLFNFSNFFLSYLLQEANYQLPRFPSLVCVYKEPHYQPIEATTTLLPSHSLLSLSLSLSLSFSLFLFLLTTVSCKAISRVFSSRHFALSIRESLLDTSSPWHSKQRSSSTTPMVRLSHILLLNLSLSLSLVFSLLRSISRCR